MDARHAAALRQFISHNPRETPIDPGAPDPLRDRAPDRSPALRTPVSRGPQPEGLDLLPLIFAQLPLQPTYRLRRHPAPPAGQRVGR